VSLYPFRDAPASPVAVAPAERSADQRELSAGQRQALLAVSEIWQRSKAAIMNRLAVLDHASLALRQGTFVAEGQRQALREAHKLVGSLGTFGFAEGSRLARELEKLLAVPERVGYGQAQRFAELVAGLRKELERGPDAPTPEPLPSDGTTRILVVDDDRELADRLALEATVRGMRVAVAPSPVEARAAIARERPDVVLLDLSFGEGAEHGLTLLRALSTCSPPIPVVVYTATDTFVDRVRVAQLGGSGFLQKPLLPAQVLEAVGRVLKRRLTVDAKIVAVDDDPQVLAVLRSLLGSRGLEVIPLGDPSRFWDVLEAESPDLLVLDVDMPGLNGVDLCRVVRNDPRWCDLPIVFLTAHTDSATVQQVFAAGGGRLRRQADRRAGADRAHHESGRARPAPPHARRDRRPDRAGESAQVDPAAQPVPAAGGPARAALLPRRPRSGPLQAG
jgi:DNA-binding response OmpR family regulator